MPPVLPAGEPLFVLPLEEERQLSESTGSLLSSATVSGLEDLWDWFTSLLPDTEPARAETTAAIAAGLLLTICLCWCCCRCGCRRYCLGNPYYCCCCCCTECCHCCMCCKNTKFKEEKDKGKKGKKGEEVPTEEEFKEQNRKNFERIDKKKKEREKAEQKRQKIKENKLRREERMAWFSSLNPFASKDDHAYRGGEVLLEQGEGEEGEANPFRTGAPVAPSDGEPAPLVGKGRNRKEDKRSFEERMAEANAKAKQIRAARKVQRRWRKHVEEAALSRGLVAGAKQRKKTRGGGFLEKHLELGGDYIMYENPSNPAGKKRKSTIGQKLRGKEPSTRLQLSQVAAVAAMEEPLSWSLMMRDGTSYEFKAESKEARNTWVKGVQERMRALARSQLDDVLTKATDGRY